MMDRIWISKPEEYLRLQRESRSLILYPKLLELIRSYSPRTILDYGCGDGSLIKLIDGESDVALYDISKKALAIAKENLRKRKVTFYTSKEDIPSKYFDCVIFSLVLMTMGRRDHLNRAAKDLFRVKNERGKLIVAVTHPCFRQYRYSTFHTDYSEGKNFNYVRDGQKFTVFLTDLVSKEQIKFCDYHWSLSTMVNLFLSSGLSLKELFELSDYAPKSLTSSNRNFPPYLILVFE